MGSCDNATTRSDPHMDRDSMVGPCPLVLKQSVTNSADLSRSSSITGGGGQVCTCFDTSLQEQPLKLLWHSFPQLTEECYTPGSSDEALPFTRLLLHKAHGRVPTGDLIAAFAGTVKNVPEPAQGILCLLQDGPKLWHCFPCSRLQVLQDASGEPQTGKTGF